MLILLHSSCSCYYWPSWNIAFCTRLRCNWQAPLFGILFLIVAGLAQLFWVMPMIKRWGTIWYYIGIEGTVLLIILWAIVRLPNITSGTGFPLNWEDISIVFLEIIYT